MRENRPYDSEGGEAKAFPTPIRLPAAASATRIARRTWLQSTWGPRKRNRWIAALRSR